MRELQKKLRKDESILWESSPEKFALLEGKKLSGRILGQWLITLGFAAWLFYVERNRPEFGTGMKLLVIAVAGAIIFAPVVEWFHLKNQRFCLTDQRAMLRTADRTWYYMDYEKIDSCCVIEDIAGGSCIAMGSAIMDDVRRQLRWQACHPKMDLQEANSHGETMGMVFYLPEGAEKMVRIMEENGVKVSRGH